MFRPPDVIEVLFTLTLRNGNEHRLQVVRFAPAPKGVIQMECREYVAPSLVDSQRVRPEFFDGNGYGMALTKGLRVEHLEFLFENHETIQAAFSRARMNGLAEAADVWGRPIPQAGL